MKYERSLEYKYPEVAKQWHPTKNDDKTPSKVTAYSHDKVWWILPYDDPETGKHFDFEWDAQIANRTKNNAGCPYISGTSDAAWKGYNDLGTKYPEIAKQWHPTKNGDRNPYNVRYRSNKEYWWILPYDDPETGKHFDFEWKRSVDARVHGDGCPYLTGKQVWKGYNDLETKYPEIAKQWHPKNKKKPNEVTAHSGDTVKWLLLYDNEEKNQHFIFEWEARIADRTTSGNGCPYIHGNKVFKGFNDLVSLYPEIAKQWNYEKNIGIDINNMTANSPKKVFWKLPYYDPNTGKHFIFEWTARIADRTADDNGCPYLSGKAVYEGFNDLKTTNPELAEEWDYKKNIKKPTEVTKGSGASINWKCKKCGYTWTATIHSRTTGNGCPSCNESKGEKNIKEYLKNNNIDFEVQYTNDKCKHKKHLRFDFAIFKNKELLVLIEYDGIQHFEPITFGGISLEKAKEKLKENKKRDKIKTKYCKDNNIPLIRISYKEFENIEQILNLELNKYITKAD